MGSENNYDESAGGVTIDQERAEYHLRCMGTDCGWRAEEVCDFIKDQQAKIKALCEIAGVGHAKIMQLDEAVRVLATMVYEWELACGLSDAWQRNGLILSRMAKGTRMSNGFDDAVRGRMNNPIAAEAVRKAGG